MKTLETPVESITVEVMGKCTTPVSDDHDDKFGVPSLEELGMFPSDTDIQTAYRINIRVYSIVLQAAHQI